MYMFCIESFCFSGVCDTCTSFLFSDQLGVILDIKNIKENHCFYNQMGIIRAPHWRCECPTVFTLSLCQKIFVSGKSQKLIVGFQWNFTQLLKIAFYGSNVEEWIVTNIFLRFFENSSDELGTGNTRHFRKSIVNNLLIFVTVHSDYL